jgi:mono/diheme cytochrome c family protein
MSMKLTLKIVKGVLATLVVVVVLFAVFVYVQSERRLRKTYAVQAAKVHIPNDSASVARGAHLYKSMISCALCHGADAGGKVYSDMPKVATVAGPNLTRGEGGVGATLADSDWVRAIRHGVRRDGTSLIVMPSEVYVHLSNDDLGAIIAYLKQVAPVNRVVPPTKFGPMGRALLAAGKMNILVAPKTPAFRDVARVPPGPTAEYGNYIADASGCHGCHGFGLSGGRVAGPSSFPPASNLTVAGIGDWTEDDFVRAMREGKRKNGTTIDDFMPWKGFSGMTDEELHALWLHLRSMPPRQYGNK